MISWHEIFEHEKQQPYFKSIMEKYQDSINNHTIFPPQQQLFRAFDLTEFSKIKVTILGQDPYHNPDQAHGLAFSVPKSIKTPPSLLNILHALNFDLKVPPAQHGDLSAWSKQGVFLLNCILSVQKNQPESGRKIGWEQFTDRIIQTISHHHSHVVFMLWGNYAQKKTALIDTKKHLILKSVHPSPLSAYRGFLECQHFSQANAFLLKHGLSPINWDLNNT
jgi:uracil-DNA glycosylase